MPRKIKNPKLKQKQKQSQHVTVKVINNIGAKRGKNGGAKKKRIGYSGGGDRTNTAVPVRYYQPLSYLPQIPQPFEQPAHTPAFKAEDFTQKVTDGVRNGFLKVLDEAAKNRAKDYSDDTSSIVDEQFTPSFYKRQPIATAQPVASSASSEVSYGIFHDRSNVPFIEDRPAGFLRPPAIDHIPHVTPNRASSPPNEVAPNKEDQQALKPAADSNDEYARFTTTIALARAKAYAAAGGSLRDLAKDGTKRGKRALGGNRKKKED
jgi:hypothetical protein